MAMMWMNKDIFQLVILTLLFLLFHRGNGINNYGKLKTGLSGMRLAYSSSRVYGTVKRPKKGVINLKRRIIVMIVGFVIFVCTTQPAYAEDSYNSTGLFPEAIAQKEATLEPPCDDNMEIGLGVEYKKNRVGIYGVLQYQYNVNNSMEINRIFDFSSYIDLPVLVGVTFYF
jgi:hypothetical protein